MSFYKFYNCFMEDTPFKLTPKDWYFYTKIYSRWSPITNAAEITISRIADVQSVFKDRHTPNNDKINCWKAIKHLEVKKVISISGEVESRYKYDKVLVISFTELESGYEQIDSEILGQINDPYHMYFVSMCYRFSNKGGFRSTQEEIAKLMSCSIDTVSIKIKEIENIYIESSECDRSPLSNGQWVSKAKVYNLVDKKYAREISGEGQETEYEQIESLDIPKFIDVTVPMGKGKVDQIKRYDVEKEIKEQICDKNSKLYYQHYYYSIKHKDVDPENYKKYIIRKKKMETGGFDFSDYEQRYEDDMKFENKIREREIIEKKMKTMTYITYHGCDEKYFIDKDIVKKMDFNEINEMSFVVEDGSIQCGKFIKIAGYEYEDKEQLTEEQYNHLVRRFIEVLNYSNPVKLSELLKIRNELQEM